MSNSFVIVLFILLSIGFIVYIEIKNNKDDIARKEKRNEEIGGYKIHEQYSIPFDCAKVEVLKTVGLETDYQGEIAYFWLHENDLMVAFASQTTPVYEAVYKGDYNSFNLNKVHFFARIGDIQKGEKSLAGAVLGGVLLGFGGAIVGSEKKSIDKRQTILEVEVEGKRVSFALSSNAYDVLLNLIPTKEYNIVLQKEQLKLVNLDNSQCNNNIEIIEQLADLRDKGIITEEEFTAKKKQILGL